MKRLALMTMMVALLGFALAAEIAVAQKPEAILGPGLDSGRTAYQQTWNRTLSPDTLYTLTGLYYVNQGYSLTIPAGTSCLADTAATLIIARGAKLYADGTECNPVVFTSRKNPGERARGDWGGIILLGRGPVNKVTPLIEGGIIAGTYGPDAGNPPRPHDDSGRLTYVRIEYPGYRFQLNNEVNGLTMGAVGDSTVIHHVQVSYSFDDAFEWFGGTVNCSHLVAIGTTDDQFDTDFGYQGKIQFAFAMDDPNLWDPTGETNGFESDNDGSSTSTAEPFTSPVFSNVTMVGPLRNDSVVLPVGNKFQYSALLRRSTRTSIHNSVIMGYPWGLRIRDVYTIQGATTDLLQVRNTSIQATTEPVLGSGCVHDTGQWAGIGTWFATAGWNNLGNAPRNPSAIGLTDMSSLTSPNPVPAPGSELIGSADFTSPQLAGFAATTYRGAFDPALPMDQQWTACWTLFNPQGWDYRLTAVPGDEMPSASVLGQNYPNPFNPSTRIAFSVLRDGRVSLKVYDLRGGLVATLVDGHLGAGRHERTFAGADLASGTYLYRLSGNGFAQTRAMQLIK